jgi:polyferredoxin
MLEDIKKGIIVGGIIFIIFGIFGALSLVFNPRWLPEWSLVLVLVLSGIGFIIIFCYTIFGAVYLFFEGLSGHL